MGFCRPQQTLLCGCASPRGVCPWRGSGEGAWPLDRAWPFQTLMDSRSTDGPPPPRPPCSPRSKGPAPDPRDELMDDFFRFPTRIKSGSPSFWRSQFSTSRRLSRPWWGALQIAPRIWRLSDPYALALLAPGKTDFSNARGGSSISGHGGESPIPLHLFFLSRLGGVGGGRFGMSHSRDGGPAQSCSFPADSLLRPRSMGQYGFQPWFSVTAPGQGRRLFRAAWGPPDLAYKKPLPIFHRSGPVGA